MPTKIHPPQKNDSWWWRHVLLFFFCQQETDPYEGYDLPLDSVPQMDPNMAAGPLSMDEMDMPYFDLTDELRRLELEELLEKEAALDDLLQAIVEEYAERAQEGRPTYIFTHCRWY